MAYIDLDIMAHAPEDRKRYLAVLKKFNLKTKKTGKTFNGWTEERISGKREDIEKYLRDDKEGYGDPDLIEYIEEGVAHKEGFVKCFESFIETL